MLKSVFASQNISRGVSHPKKIDKVFTWISHTFHRVAPSSDACHLEKYCLNPVRREVTEVAEVLNSLDMVVDKLHFRNHTEKWCKEKCNPYDRMDLEGVNRYSCKRTFC